jgi:hypothetical protein
MKFWDEFGMMPASRSRVRVQKGACGAEVEARSVPEEGEVSAVAERSKRKGGGGKKTDPVTRYARAVIAGEILTGRAVRQACERHLRDLASGSGRQTSSTTSTPRRPSTSSTSFRTS